MDDIFKPLDQNALNELTSEPAGQAPQPAPQSVPQQQPPTTPSPNPQPMSRGSYQVPVRRPMMRPMAMPQPQQPIQQAPSPTPVRSPEPPQPLAPPMPQAQPAPQPAPEPPAQPGPTFQPPQQPQFQPQPDQQPFNTPQPTSQAADNHVRKSRLHTRLPKGIYILAGLALLDLIISYFSGNHNHIYWLVMMVDLIIMAALLTKYNMARKAALAFQGVGLFALALVMVGLMFTEARINELSVQYNNIVAKADVTTTPQQEVTIDNINTQLNLKHNEIGKGIGIAYIRSSLAIFVSLGLFWYLTRPAVKAAFH
ncbi:MAG TPA: hypothetical protein VLG27_02620 [Candidatus Saccharimonadia bacterium]|nr:hypothetical protein [Candidatus Saccharimonadia bacterium]